MAVQTSPPLEGVALESWRSYLQSHAAILRELDASLLAEHGMTTRDYEALLYLAQSEGRRLPMSALAERTMLTRSGITRLVDGLVGTGLIERVSCPSDARVSYAKLTETGYQKLRQAGCTHVASIQRLFLEHFSPPSSICWRTFWVAFRAPIVATPARSGSTTHPAAASPDAARSGPVHIRLAARGPDGGPVPARWLLAVAVRTYLTGQPSSC